MTPAKAAGRFDPSNILPPGDFMEEDEVPAIGPARDRVIGEET
jgi:hypothetical protein